MLISNGAIIINNQKIGLDMNMVDVESIVYNCIISKRHINNSDQSFIEIVQNVYNIKCKVLFHFRNERLKLITITVNKEAYWVTSSCTDYEIKLYNNLKGQFDAIFDVIYTTENSIIYQSDDLYIIIAVSHINYTFSILIQKALCKASLAHELLHS